MKKDSKNYLHASESTEPLSVHHARTHARTFVRRLTDRFNGTEIDLGKRTDKAYELAVCFTVFDVIHLIKRLTARRTHSDERVNELH